MFKKVAFTMYPVEDMPRARKFYEETLGLGPAKQGRPVPGWSSTSRAAAAWRSRR